MPWHVVLFLCRRLSICSFVVYNPQGRIMEANERRLEYYETADGKVPFREWFVTLRDHKAQARIDARLARVQLGNLGESEPVGEGVMELKIDYGPGYRVYFGQVGTSLILLLYGGDKSTQKKDIKTARKHWADYRRRHGAQTTKVPRRPA
jgi:putative addiction module killer protein